jgi:hypothetical protein
MFRKSMIAAAGLSLLLGPAALFAGHGYMNGAGGRFGNSFRPAATPVATCPNADCPNPDCPNAPGPNAKGPKADCPNPDCPRNGTPNAKGGQGHRTGPQDGTGPRRDGSCRS